MSAALPLAQVRVLSLALNLPGPAALMRCRRMGATCTKLEPPSGDPMRLYEPSAYAELHEGVQVLEADLKTEAGQAIVHRELARADVLLTSFRPSALKIGTPPGTVTTCGAAAKPGVPLAASSIPLVGKPHAATARAFSSENSITPKALPSIRQVATGWPPRSTTAIA